MNSINRKLLLTQLVVNLVTMLAIVVVNILIVPGKFEQSFLLPWLVSNSLIVYIKYLIPITLTGFIICFSILISHEDIIALKTQSFFYLIRGGLNYTLVMVLVYLVLLLLVLPWTYQQRAIAEFRSDFIGTSIERAGEYLNREEYQLANREVENALRLVPLHEEGTSLYQRIQELSPETPVEPPPEEIPPTVPTELEFSEISAKAEQYFAEEDYFSALFYARLALGHREERADPVARRILTESLRIIERTDLSESERREQDLFYLKKSAAEAYNSGEYINAYYTFRDIQSLRPFDPDAQTYLEDIKPRIENISFFLDEIADSTSGEVRKNIFIRLPDPIPQSVPQSDTDLTETTGVADTAGTAGTGPKHRFLSAEQVMLSTAGMYFIDLEYLELDQSDSLLKHIKIPRAKLSGTYLITRVIDRGQRGELYQPEYIKGQGRNTFDLVDISASEDELWTISSNSTSFDDVSILQLFSFATIYSLSGRNPAFPQTEILYRIMLPLSLINAALFVIAYAWRGRSRYISGPPVYTIIFTPLIPLFVLGLFELYTRMFRNILASILLLTNFPVSLAILFGLQGFLFVIILLFLTRQKPE